MERDTIKWAWNLRMEALQGALNALKPLDPTGLGALLALRALDSEVQATIDYKDTLERLEENKDA